MNSQLRLSVLLAGMLSGIWMQQADAQLVDVSVTDPFDLCKSTNDKRSGEADVLPVGYCFCCDPDCDTGCDTLSRGPTCDAMGTCSCLSGRPKCECCSCRETLFGDTWGYYKCFAEHGITYQGSFTQFYLGVTSGGENRKFRYTAKFDSFYTFDSEQLGLWEGGKLIMHSETVYGQNSIVDAAGMAPANTALLTPRFNDLPVYAITGFQYEQELGYGYAATIGRYNFIDLWAQLYPDYGRGLDGFMNISSLISLNVTPTLPIVFNGAGLIKSGEKGIEAAVLVLDPDNIPTVTGLGDELFNDGSTILGAYRIFTELGGLPGSHLVAGSYETRTITSFEEKGWLALPPGIPLVPLLSERTGSWLGAYVGRQTLWQDRCDKNRRVWFMTTMGWSDRKTSPYEWTGACSIEAVGLNKRRKHDRMGISYFYSDVSDDLEALPEAQAIGLNDLQGGEFYYNAEINPWFHLTGDLQVIETEIDSQDTAIVLGVRAKIEL